MVQHIAVSEQRFREGLGKRTLQDGTTVRCQGTSKAKLRAMRIELNNPDLAAHEIWPDCQCIKPAEGGTFLCKFHGGRTPGMQKKLITAYMPLDLQEKNDSLRDDSELLNRFNELAQLQARNAQLYEMLEELVLPEEAYGAVAVARRKIDSGDIIGASAILQGILGNPRTEESIWAEMRENIKIQDKLATDQFSMLKEMRTMASTDQVTALMETAFKSFTLAVERHIKDRDQINAILTEVHREMSRASNSIMAKELVSGSY